MIINNQSIPKSIHNKSIIAYECDGCQNKFQKRWDQRIKSHNLHKKDLCRSCSSKISGEKRKGRKVPAEQIERQKKARATTISKKWPKLTKYCEYCNKEFTISYGRRNKAKYCCKKCQLKGHKVWSKGNDSRKVLKCQVCYKEFKSYSNQVVCSRHCLSKYMSKMCLGDNNPNWIPRENLQKSKCPNCGQVFAYSKNGLHKGQRRLFCSLKCSRLNGNNKNIQNKDGYKIESKKYDSSIYYDSNPYPSEWNDLLKKKIKKRDNYCCQLCDSNNKLEIHHINNDKKNCEENNLITLCKKCHNLTKHNKGFWEQIFIGLNSKSKIVKKGWGLEIHFVNHDEYCLKYLVFFKGKRFSWHKHNFKKELWFCNWGKFECYIKNKEFEDYFIFKQGDKIEILPGVEHQLQAIANCIITEVSTIDYPEDSIRIEKGD